MSPSASAWRAQRTEDGSWTLLHPVHGESCHSLAGAWTQARERYASLIADLPPEITARGVVRLLDIGTGMGFNLAAAIEACEARGLSLDALSLELDPEVLRATLELGAPLQSQAHTRVLELIGQELAFQDCGCAQESRLVPGGGAHRVQLILGDAREKLPAQPENRQFDAVFLDPFSPRVDPPLWQEDFLREVARRMASGARLASYTSSLRVRVALARAGLDLGTGPRVGRKASGTLAARGGGLPPLDPRTQRKLDRALASRST
ncbi:MAG TPA: MnmC family methyltransferase [Planctomycetota bacterium]|nr:MnmC family methyltransferase [Planctomycetota bacterium]